MKTDFHDQVRRILEQCAKIKSSAHEPFIVSACRNDLKLMSETLSLLPQYRATRVFGPQRPRDVGRPWAGTTTFVGACPRTPTVPANDVESGLPFCMDQYRVSEVLGCGGMGVVYRGTHSTLKRTFAIKVLRRRYLSAPGRFRFGCEIEIHRCLSRPGHPGIARFLHDAEAGADRPNARGTACDGRPYFVMEDVSGTILTDYAKASRLSLWDRLVLFARICDAVEYVHRRAIVHRDLKPSNILVDATGYPKILDFGIAHCDAFDSFSLPDQRRRFVGTFRYASPEQKSGNIKTLSPRSDVYTLGVIAHELLTGHLPKYDQSARRTSLVAVHKDSDSCEDNCQNREIRFFLDQVLDKALSESAERRYETAGALGSAVSRLLAQYEAKPRVPTRWSIISKWFPLRSNPIRGTSQQERCHSPGAQNNPSSRQHAPK